jgi:formylglycine-generating enzyme required for sulfatase activity
VSCLLGARLQAAPAPLPAQEPAAGTEIVCPSDGAIMVYVPSGTFIMGMDADESDRLAKALGYKDYHVIAAEEWMPRHTVYVEGFFIDKYEVTVGQWAKYAAATNYKSKLPKGPDVTDHSMDMFPAVNIYWAEAQQYANWAHKQLPYESQWEKAARGTDGRWFPWGNELPTPDRGVFVDLSKENHNKPTQLQMVGTKPAGTSPYGCMDMAGNAYEWTREWVEPYPNNPEADKMGSAGHQFGCLRGGSFYHADHAYCCAKRFGFRPDETYYHVGFRTVWVPPAGYFASDDFKKAVAAVPQRKAELDKLRELGKNGKPLIG